MRLASTRDKALLSSFSEAVFQGIAPDGGLYVPVGFPNLGDLFLSFSADASFLTVATETAQALLGEELGDETVAGICKEAFSFSPAVSSIEPGVHILELYHGPSCAFKDFGASFLATVMEQILARTSRQAIILTATSGDTGSAVAQAFKGRTAVKVVVLYPSGRVSPLQEKQLTTVGGNVHALEVQGSFDDCQRLVKEAFLDSKLKKALPLTSANSINIGRLLPQAFYYIWGWNQVRHGFGPTEAPIWFCVPSGNFGNLTAGVLAGKWGLYQPESRYIAATNANDVVPEYLRTSIFSPRASVHTYSNAMDVGNPSNFERLRHIFDGDCSRMRDWLIGETVTDGETLAEMRDLWVRSRRALDPHTAVGYAAARRRMPQLRSAGGEMVVLATAHPAKFVEIVREATGTEPELPPVLALAMEKEKVSTVIRADLEALAGYLTRM